VFRCFSGDDVFQRIGVLFRRRSRNRYALPEDAWLHPLPTFCLLDEPTNHLDLRAKTFLLEAL